MKHLIIRDANLQGWAYGMLRSFENAIIEETNAGVSVIPDYSMPAKYFRHFGNGMNRGKYRRYFPKDQFNLDCDVAWYILMGPEDYRLDVFKGWNENTGKKILYLYDTFPSQYDLIARIVKDQHWDLLITSFNDAVDDLTRLTRREWICIEQAADRDLFLPVSLENKLIHFSSYGRKETAFHEIVKSFVSAKGLYYDYTTHDVKHPTAEPYELYKQYAWHLTHSLFTFSWPVEITNPARAAHLRPITCRWFEALASGTIMAGAAPANPAFVKQLSPNAVRPFNLNAGKDAMVDQLNTFWNLREKYFEDALKLSDERRHDISWHKRVQTILDHIK